MIIIALRHHTATTLTTNKNNQGHHRVATQFSMAQLLLVITISSDVSSLLLTYKASPL